MQHFEGKAQRATLRFISSLKATTKDIHEHPDGVMHKVRSGRVLSAGSSVPVELGVQHPPCGCVYTPGRSLNPRTFRILWGLRHVGMIDHGLHFQPLSLKRMEGRLKMPSFSNYGLFFH